jgi:hypothetical protein
MSLSIRAKQSLKQALINAAANNEIAAILDGLPDVFTIDQIVTLTNAVSTALATQVPAGAVITSICANADTLVEGDASGDNLLARVAIGISGTIAKYGAMNALTKNTKLTATPTHAVLASAETITLFAAKTDNSAATEKFVAGGRVRVRITYLRAAALPDA